MIGQEKNSELVIETVKLRSTCQQRSSTVIPKDFFAQLPEAKVTLLTSKGFKRNDSKTTEVTSIPKSQYDLPDDFVVPENLCIEHEKGVRLVSFFSSGRPRKK